jgi:hypothetical protein
MKYRIFSNTPRTFFPKNCDQKLGCAAYSRITKLVKTRLHQDERGGGGAVGGGERAFVLWCECASTLLTANALSKLSLFLPRAKRSLQTAQCECTFVGDVNVYVFYENDYKGHVLIFHD